jgi:hypothetical protein
MPPRISPKGRPRTKTSLGTAGADLSAIIGQSTAEKLFASASYPLTIVDHSDPFHGYATSGTTGDAVLPAKTVAALLAAADASGNQHRRVSDIPKSPDDQLNAQVLSGTGEVIEAARACLRARKEAEAAGQPFEGPSEKEMQAILDGGVQGLANIAGIEFRVHLAWIRIDVSDAPIVGLNGPRIDLRDLHGAVGATAELWWYHPTVHCKKGCWDWSITWDWSRLAAITLWPVKLDVDAHADAYGLGPIVRATFVLDRFRLDYPILREIPLEKIVNAILGDQSIPVFDGSQFIATVPLVGSKFHLSGLSLPAASGETRIDITIART